jgi:glutathione synthase
MAGRCSERYVSCFVQPIFVLEVVHRDKFTGRLLELAFEVYRTKPVDEDIRLYLLRNDFLPTDGDSRILQVEINTISSGFAGILESLSQIHASNKLLYYPSLPGDLPRNTPCHAFAPAIAQAVGEHNLKWGRSSRAVLFVIEEGERNIVDQYAIELILQRDFGLTVIRKTLQNISNRSTLTEEGFLLFDSIEVALVYFRSGYDPKHYPSGDVEWEARKLIEKSKSVKCPSLLAQLAGTKKVQQLWYQDNGSVLRRFGLSESEILSLFEVFAIQTDPSVDTVSSKKAIENPDGWVLKPQREGGGNNLYGEELRHALVSLDHEELAQYVLMERMNPVPRPALVVDSAATLATGSVVPTVIGEAVSELGIFSFYLPRSGKGDVCGHLLRTKDKAVREGGVNAGFAYLDTASLI